MLLGKQEERHAILRPASFYESQRIELITGERVSSIETPERRVVVGARRVGYDALVLATGASNRALPLQGASLAGVCYLRSLTESGEIRQQIEAAENVVVIGGGFIGLEVAAAARTLGRNVTVVEAQDRLMARVAAPVVSSYFRARHVAQGVRVLLNAQVEEIRGAEGKVQEVLLHDGRRVPADLVVIGIGVTPNVDLARAARLLVGNGIAVDARLRTGDARIFAIGDCAEYPNVFAQARVRLESVQNAVDQGTNVARALTGREEPYEAAPWFWTDQFDLHLQMAGISTGYDQTALRGNPETGRFSVFYYREGRLLAVDSVNHAAEHLTARKLIGGRVHVRPEEAADEDFDLRGAIGAAG